MLVTIQAFNAKQIEIPQSVIDGIPKDRRKNLTAYVVAQAGDHKVNVIQDQTAMTKVYSWGRQVIQALTNMVKGIPFFRKHGLLTNSHAGRKEMGRVEAAYETTIDGVPSTVVIGSFDDKPTDDVVSIEAEVSTISESNEKEIVKGLENVTAIAMGSRAEGDNPGFAGAERLAYIQCYVSKVGTNNDVSKNGGNEMTLAEVKKFIAEQQVLPNQLFGTPELERDTKLWDSVRAHFDKKVQDGLKAKDKELKETKEKLATYERQEQQVKGRETVIKQIDDGNYTDFKKDFYKKRLERYDGDLDEEGVTNFFEKAKTDWEDFGAFAEKQQKTNDPNDPATKEKEDDEVEELVEEILTGGTGENNNGGTKE